MEWISVEDSLPEPTEDVLFFDMFLSFHIIEIGNCFKKGVFVSGENWYYDVTHWMPLPKPPKE